MGYKAQVVTYALSYLVDAIAKNCPDRAFDFKNVWSHQAVTHATELQLAEIAEAMYNHLVSPAREVQNVTEWAKRENCWKAARALIIPLRQDFIKELAYSSDQKAEKKSARKEQKHQNNASAMITVAEYGVENWKKLLQWGTANHVLTPVDISFIRVAIAMEQGKFPSEKQCSRILQILEKARLESYPG